MERLEANHNYKSKKHRGLRFKSFQLEFFTIPFNLNQPLLFYLILDFYYSIIKCKCVWQYH